MVSSLLKVHPDANIFLITHETSLVPDGLTVDRVLRIPAVAGPPAHLHLLRVVGWLIYSGSEFFDSDTISVDADVLFQQDPAPVFKDRFDIGLTYECIQKTHWATSGKINSGVMFLRPENKARVEDFFARFLDVLVEMQDEPDRRFIWENRHPTLKEWGGDEIALMAMFRPGQLASPDQAVKDVELDGLRIRVYPSRPWNCQICDRQGDVLTMPFLDDAVIRHFNGRRKSQMEAYAAQNLGIHLDDDATSPIGARVRLSMGSG